MSATSLAFKIIYNVIYYFLYLVLIAFLLITPADLIHQALAYHQEFYNILVIALCYLVTIIVVGFIYAARLYISRSVLASIPKQWIPIEKGDLPRDVRRMVVESLSRSAAIMYASRPRIPIVEASKDPNRENEDQRPGTGQQSLRVQKQRKGSVEHGATSIVIPPPQAPWGEIEHPGWSCPLSPDLPDLQYSSVVLELPNLIEAKAITLAPEYPSAAQAEQPMLDPEAVGFLQRGDSMGLRDYLVHLTGLGVLAPSPVIFDFITKYERARFSARPLTNDQFRELMHLFAEVLRSMSPMNPAVLYGDEEDKGDGSSPVPPYDTDIDNDAPLGTNPSTPASRRSLYSQQSNGSLRVVRPRSPQTANSLLRQPGTVARNSSANTWQYRTAPTTPKSRQTGISRSSSMNSFAQTRHPYPLSRASSPSLGSVSGGSVIRLADVGDNSNLPYVLMHPHTQ